MPRLTASSSCLQLKALGYHPKCPSSPTAAGCLCKGPLPASFPTPSICCVAFMPSAPPFDDCATGAQWQRPKAMADKLTGALSDPSKRTGSAFDTPPRRSPRQPGAAVVTRLLPNCPAAASRRSTWRPTTSHAAERFLGAFDRFYRAKGPFKIRPRPRSMSTSSCEVMFETFSAEAARSARPDAPASGGLLTWKRFRCFMYSIGLTPRDCATHRGGIYLAA